MDPFNKSKNLIIEAAQVVGGKGFAYRIKGKLRFDPIYRLLVSLWPKIGSDHTYDLGGGMGLLPFLLKDSGRFTVIDHDPKALEWGQKLADALGESARVRFVQNSLESLDIHEFGNILLIDVLHYLSPSAQERLITSLADLQKEGQLIAIRDISDSLGMRTMMTILQEKISLSLGRTKGSTIKPIDFEVIKATLKARGYGDFEILPASQGTPFANQLFLAKRGERFLV